MATTTVRVEPYSAPSGTPAFLRICNNCNANLAVNRSKYQVLHWNFCPMCGAEFEKPAQQPIRLKISEELDGH